MTERKANERRNWKGVLFPYDIFIPDDSPECQYCLTDKQAMLIRGLLEPVGWETRWWSDTTDIDKDTIEAFRDDMIRRLMMACCNGDFPLIYQWTVDGVLQVSDDGGETFTDAPQQDPRNSSTVYPPVAGDVSDDKKCIAATGMGQIIKTQVGDQLTDDMSQFTLQELIDTWVGTILQTSNPFQALLNIAVNQIFALVIATLRPALTDDVYHTLVCIFFCNIADDLSFDNASWEAVRAAILDQISGIAGIFLEHLVFLMGKVGLTNLARSQAATTGDCSDCDCGETCTSDGWALGFWTGGSFTATGNEDSRTTNTITAHSIDRGDGQQWCYFSTTGAEQCCDVSAVIDTGTGTLAVAIFCGTNRDVSNMTILGLSPANNVNAFAVNFTVAGTVTITFAPV